MLNLTINQCLIAMAFLVPLVIYLARRPIIETIDLPEEQQETNEYNANYGAYIQAQGRYYN